MGRWCLNLWAQKKSFRETEQENDFPSIVARNCPQLHTIERHRSQSLRGVLEMLVYSFPFGRSTFSREKKLSSMHNDRQILHFHESFCPAYVKWNWKFLHKLIYIGCGHLYWNIYFKPWESWLAASWSCPLIVEPISGSISKEWYSNFPFHLTTTLLSSKCICKMQRKISKILQWRPIC